MSVVVNSKFNNPKSKLLEIDHVVIAIVSTRDVEHVVNCLRSLANSSYRNFSVVVCENGDFQAFDRLTNAISSLECMCEFTGDNDEVPSTRSFSFENGGQLITIFKNSANLGYAGGVNACVAAVADAAWEAVWVLNPDTFPDANALAALVQHQKSGGYGIVGSRLLFASNGRVQTWGGMKWRKWLGRGQSLGLNLPAEFLPNVKQVEAALGFISGASMYVSRAYVEAVGVMDEDFFVYDEDVDWCLRHGTFKLGYAHDSIVRHVNGGTSGPFSSSGSRFTVYLDSRNRILLARKCYPRCWQFFAVLSLVHVAVHYYRSMSVDRLRYALDGWWAGLCGEKGAPKFINEDAIRGSRP